MQGDRCYHKGYENVSFLNSRLRVKIIGPNDAVKVLKMAKELLAVKNITKSFPGVNALKDISLTVYEGEVLCLAGENGAGKSTLIKVLSGIYIPEEGEIYFQGKPCHFKTPLASLQTGISVVHQEHKLIENLTVAENIFFGRFPMKNGLVDFQKMFRETDAIIRKLGLTIKARDKVDRLTSSQSQMVEIAKAYSRDFKLMILDEPSSSITDTEVLTLLDLINALKKEGKSFIYVSHKLKEMFVIGDRVAVLKDGCHMGTYAMADIDVDKIVTLMVGRDIGSSFTPKDREIGAEALRVENLSNGVVEDFSFHINKGEIVGLSGLVGAGRSEAAESIFGYRRKRSGRVFVNGAEVHIRKPKDAIAAGIGFITEDRKKTGAIQVKSVGMNITFVNLAKYIRYGIINAPMEKKDIESSIEQLSVKTPSPRQEVQFLSGGNQQKVILAKWLLSNSKVLICDEPTKGIDVGTKQEFYQILDSLARKGVAVLVISSELTEIIGLSNRVYVVRSGRIRAELSQEQLTEENIAYYAMRDEGDQAV